MEFSRGALLIFLPWLIAFTTDEASSLNGKGVDNLILTGATTNLRKQLSKPALGNVEPKLRSLVDKTETVDRKWHSAVKNEVSTLEACIRAIDGTGAKTDIGQLQNYVKAVITVLKAIGSDVINLRSKAHMVIEAARGRSRKLKSDASSLQDSIEANARKQQSVQNTIDRINKRIDQKETEAWDLNGEAHSAQKKADNRKAVGVLGTAGGVAGMLGVVAGFVTAPFTLGASLAATAVGIGAMVSAEQAESQARYYRRWAAEQRSQIRELQDEVSSYRQEKSRLETDLQNKHQELRTVLGFERDMELVGINLNAFSDLLNRAVDSLQDFDVNLGDMSHITDIMEIGNWRSIRDFLDSMKRLK